jgi:hypothetical protein
LDSDEDLWRVLSELLTHVSSDVSASIAQERELCEMLGRCVADARDGGNPAERMVKRMYDVIRPALAGRDPNRHLRIGGASIHDQRITQLTSPERTQYFAKPELR